MLSIFGRSLTSDILVAIFSGNICGKIKCQQYPGIGATNIWQWFRRNDWTGNIVVKLSANIYWGIDTVNIWQWFQRQYLGGNFQWQFSLQVKLSDNIIWELVLPIFGSCLGWGADCQDFSNGLCAKTCWKFAPGSYWMHCPLIVTASLVELLGE